MKPPWWLGCAMIIGAIFSVFVVALLHLGEKTTGACFVVLTIITAIGIIYNGEMIRSGAV